MATVSMPFRVVRPDGTNITDTAKYTRGRPDQWGEFDHGTLRDEYDQPIAPPWIVQRLDPDGTWVTVLERSSPADQPPEELR